MANKTSSKINCSESNFSDEDRTKIDNFFFEALEKLMEEERKKRGVKISNLTETHPINPNGVDATSLQTLIRDHYIKKADELMKKNYLNTSIKVLVFEKHGCVLPSLISYWVEKKLVVKKYKEIFITEDEDKNEVNCVKIKLSWNQ